MTTGRMNQGTPDVVEATAAIRTAASVRRWPAPAPASMSTPRAAQPSRSRIATYRMLSQWTKPERNVMAFPAENGAAGKGTRTTAVTASAVHAKYRCDRVSERRRAMSQPTRPSSPTMARQACRRGQFR